MALNHPYAEHLGITSTKIQKGSATVQVETQKHHTNILGYVHGGLLYSLADVAFELASNSHEPDAVGISTHMEFYRPVKVGQIIEATATESHLGRKLATYLIEVKSDGKLLATFTGTVYRLT